MELTTEKELQAKIKACGTDYFLMYGYVRQLEYLKMRKKVDSDVLQDPLAKAAE